MSGADETLNHTHPTRESPTYLAPVVVLDKCVAPTKGNQCAAPYTLTYSATNSDVSCCTTRPIDLYYRLPR